MLRGLDEVGRCLLDFVYPPACWACDTPLAHASQYLCSACWESILAGVRAPARCVRCGCPVPAPRAACVNCAAWNDGEREAGEDKDRPAVGDGGVVFERAVVLAPYEPPMQQAIHALKFRGCRGLAELLGRRLGEELRETLRPVDVVVPVPLHPARRRERGYNQSLFIARGLAEALRVPLETGLLRRTVNTHQQARLSAGARRRNLAVAFRAVGKFTGSGCVAVVDDVMTTGSTLDACAQVLRRAGTPRVWAVTLASRFRHEALAWRQTTDCPPGSVDFS